MTKLPYMPPKCCENEHVPELSLPLLKALLLLSILVKPVRLFVFWFPEVDGKQ